MSSAATIAIHKSQFPEKVRRDLLGSLHDRKINHKFHYDSVKQTQKWLALHQMYSPSRNDENCRAIYEQSFECAAAKIKSKNVLVIGLGCGGGQKDVTLLKSLKSRGKGIFYMPCDVSVAMVLVARQTGLEVLPEKSRLPFVCDLATAGDWPEMFKRRENKSTARLVTFFGMIPNFEPQSILPKLVSLIRAKDFLLISANLAPGESYDAGMIAVLPQYDNTPTHDWLMMFLADLGIEKSDGNLQFAIEDGKFGLKRFVANFHFKRTRQIKIEEKTFNFKTGQKIRLFFSYRYTPELAETILGSYGLAIYERWIAKSGEEGVFLCRRK